MQQKPVPILWLVLAGAFGLAALTLTLFYIDQTRNSVGSTAVLAPLQAAPNNTPATWQGSSLGTRPVTPNGGVQGKKALMILREQQARAVVLQAQAQARSQARSQALAQALAALNTQSRLDSKNPSGVTIEVMRSGEPVSGCRVRLFLSKLVGGNPLAEMTTSREGLAPLPPPYPKGGMTAVIDADNGPRVLHIPANTMNGLFTVDLDQQAKLVGTVFGSEEGPIVAKVTLRVGALVVAETSSGPDDGVFSLDVDTANLGTLEVVAPGYVPTWLPLGRNWTMNPSLDIVLRKGETGSIRGKVVDDQNFPVNKAVVRLISTGRGSVKVVTGADGWFTASELPTGSLKIEAYTSEGVPFVVTSRTIRAGETVTVVLQGQERSRLTVRVRKSDGAPAGGLLVRLIDPTIPGYERADEASGVEQAATTAADGTVQFQVPAGRYFVRAGGTDNSGTAEAVVRRGENNLVVVDLPTARTLTVKVVDTSGAPIRGVFVDASLRGFQRRNMPAQSTGANGKAVFVGLPRGLVELHLGYQGNWRLAWAEGSEVRFEWTDPGPIRLSGHVEGGFATVLAVVVLPDVVKWEVIPLDGNQIGMSMTAPKGLRRVYLVAPNENLAPFSLGTVDPSGDLMGFKARFTQGAGVAGTLSQAGESGGIPGNIHLPGDIGGVFEARRQWLSGRAEDEWATANEWLVETGPDGRFELLGLPSGRTTLRFDGIGVTPLEQTVILEGGAVQKLGTIQLSQ